MTTVVILTADQILDRVITRIASALGLACATVRTLDEAERTARSTNTVVVVDEWMLAAPGLPASPAERIAALAHLAPVLVLEFSDAAPAPTTTNFRTLKLPFELDELEREINELASRAGRSIVSK